MHDLFFWAGELSQDRMCMKAPHCAMLLWSAQAWTPARLHVVAVITGNSELAQVLWHRCEEQPMRLALIAAAICKELARRCAAERSWATQELQSLALTYEGWAISMISSSVTTMEAYAVLGSRFRVPKPRDGNRLGKL
eukprot:2502717-Prymnesium_polylepis.2